MEEIPTRVVPKQRAPFYFNKLFASILEAEGYNLSQHKIGENYVTIAHSLYWNAFNVMIIIFATSVSIIDAKGDIHSLGLSEPYWSEDECVEFLKKHIEF